MTIKNKNILRLLLAFCMILWGSIGLLTRTIHLDSVELAFNRAFLSLPILFFIFHFSKKDKGNISHKYIIYYLVSGALIGLAWVCLFQAYKYTSMSNAVLIYNMCPVYVIIISHFVLKEKITLSRIITIIGCLVGLILLISKTLEYNKISSNGILWAFASGLLYSIIVIMNKKANLKNKKSNTTQVTLIQLLGASLALLPYQISHSSFSNVIHLGNTDMILLLILAIIYTPFTYIIYFSMYKKLEAIEIVSFSYLEPLFAILFGTLVFHEQLSVIQLIGGLMILCFTFFGELYNIRKGKN